MKKVKIIEKQGKNEATLTLFAEVPYAGEDCDWGVARKAGLVDPYTGNLSFETRDLSLAGAVGRYGLHWSRVATSRESGHQPLFGQGHNWTHNWQWDLAFTGEAEGEVATVHEPSGTAYQFSQDTSGGWQPVSPAVTHKLSAEEDGFALQLLDGMRVRFSPNEAEPSRFVATKLYDPQSNVWTLSYDETGRLSQVAEPAGRTLSLSYETLNSPITETDFVVISKVTGSDEQELSYHYEFPADVDYPVLTTVTYPDETQASYTYAAPRPADRILLVSAEDPHAEHSIRGRLFIYRTEAEAAFGQVYEIRTLDGEALFYRLEPAPESSPEDRHYAITLDNGAVTHQTYNQGGNLAQMVDGNGDNVQFEYANEGRGLRITEINELGDLTSYEHDANGKLIKTTFPDGSTRLQTWDDLGHLLSTTDELGNTTAFSYDNKGRLITTQQADGTTLEATYNDLGQVTSYTQPTSDGTGGSGQAASHTQPDLAVTRFSYDERGLLVQATNPLGRVTSYEYDSYDRLAAVTHSGNTTRYGRDAAGRTIQIIYPDEAEVSFEYNPFGQVTQAVDPTGVKEYMKYDELGRQIERGRNNTPEIQSEYAPIGSLAPAEQPIKQVSAMGRTVSLEYDAKGQITARTTAAEADTATTTHMTYDAAGRLISNTDPAGRTTSHSYDSRGRRIQTTSPLGHTSTVEYDAVGNKLSETDPAGNVTQWTYDVLGRELTKTDANGETTTREYDSAGRLITLTDAKGNAHHFEYDLMGNQTALIYPDGSQESTSYNNSGLKLSFTNRAGATQSFEHDNREREIKSEWSDGTQTVTKEYDAAGRTTLEDNGVSHISYAYDSSGRLESQIQQISSIVSEGAFEPEPRTLTYGYDDDDNLIALGYPDESVIKYEYEAHGWLSKIFDESNASLLASYEYDAVGNPTQMTRGNTIVTASLFDDENHSTSITEGITAQEPLSQLHYQYNEVGNRTGAERILNGFASAPVQEQEQYSYDPIHQVLGTESQQNGPSGTGNSTVAFSYDALGNRITVDENEVTTNYTSNALNQYTQVGDGSLSYDANGNLVEVEGWAYQYDALNRLISASNENITARFWYDSRNRVVARSYQAADAETPTLTLNTYDEWNLIEERDETGAQKARYVYGSRSDEIVLIWNEHGTFYPHRDALGSITMLTDSEGKLAERYRYSVTGEVTIYGTNGTELPNSAVGNRWLFTGREFLAEIGLYDYRNRIYSAKLGRFLQTDPIRFDAEDLNLYRYVNNNLVNLNDPEGIRPSWRSDISTNASDILKGWFYIFDRTPGKDWKLGSPGTRIPEGSPQGKFLESFLPVGHPFAVNHDAFIDIVPWPRWLSNIPTMIPIYAYTFIWHSVYTITAPFRWLYNLFF